MLDGKILPDGAVGLRLQPLEVFCRDGAVKVHLHSLLAHVKAHVVVAVLAVNEAGEDMLAGVLLHQVKPPTPIDAAFCGSSHFQGAVAQVDDGLASP